MLVITMGKSFDSKWVSLKGGGKRKWWIRLKAKIDTGASRCSIDKKLANALGLKKVGEIQVRNAMGKQTRQLVEAKIRIGRTTYDVELSITDRTELSCAMILGKELIDRVNQNSLSPQKSGTNVPQFV